MNTMACTDTLPDFNEQWYLRLIVSGIRLPWHRSSQPFVFWRWRHIKQCTVCGAVILVFQFVHCLDIVTVVAWALLNVVFAGVGFPQLRFPQHPLEPLHLVCSARLCSNKPLLARCRPPDQKLVSKVTRLPVSNLPMCIPVHRALYFADAEMFEVSSITLITCYTYLMLTSCEMLQLCFRAEAALRYRTAMGLLRANTDGRSLRLARAGLAPAHSGTAVEAAARAPLSPVPSSSPPGLSGAAAFLP